MEAATQHPGSSRLDRIAAAFVLVLLAAGCLVLWAGIPAAWLWVAGRITAEPTAHILVSILGFPVAMIAWAKFLVWLNRLYLRVTFPGTRPGGGDLDPDEAMPRGPLDALLVGALVLAVAAMAFWFFVLAEDPGAWVF